jgi:hypothetical protein
METQTPKKYWFVARTYGYGWTPASWQGWVLLLAYVTALLYVGGRVQTLQTTRALILEFGVPAVLLTIGFLWIVIKTGEKPRWQWGVKKDIQK